MHGQYDRLFETELAIAEFLIAVCLTNLAYGYGSGVASGRADGEYGLAPL